MATSLRCSCLLVLVALLPTFGGCIRPFRVPTNLFVQGASSNTFPEGVRMIRREALDEVDLGSPQELVEDLHGRYRRDANQPEVSRFSLGYYDTYFMYWPRNNASENYVFLLGKNTTRSKSSKVFLSTNYGKSFTSLNLTSPSTPSPLIDQIYYGKADPKLCILADKVNKVLHRTDDLVTFTPQKITWEPSYLTFHPWDRNFVMGYDKSAEKLYWSKNSGQTFNEVPGEVKSFNWGFEGLDAPDVIFVETYQKSPQQRLQTRDSRTSVKQVDSKGKSKTLASDVEEFEMMKNYMFITTRTDPKAKNPILKVVKNRNFPFKNTSFPSNEESRDFFVFDVVEDHVFVVINHLRNLSNMYVSDMSGLKYQLSLPRVLYHNPFTNVSSPWLRSVIPYAFVDVDRIKSMRGIYIATQLTPGPVGKRHLLTLITYNRGGKWQRVRSPTVDNRGVRINCYLPSCSIHLNLLYGAVYRVSPSERLLSSESAPGLVIGLGVASTNLKIYPDLFVSLDGGLGWSRVLRGKYLFTFGDHGGVIIAVPYRRYTKTLRYSTDGGFTWKPYIFSSVAILARDVVTQPGERLPIFVIYGNGNRNRAWTAFYINMTNVMGPLCDSSGFTSFTDGCLLGRQQQFETRNWTIHCHAGRGYSRSSFVRNCECTRDDFQCDYGFERKRFDEECTPIKSEDLNTGIIPKKCPEGTNYSRTQGFRKIEGDTCVNGSEKDFLPVLTPCPIGELENLTLTGVGSNVTKDGGIAVETGAKVSFNASLPEAYQPNIAYRWSFGDGQGSKGMGIKFASQQYTYSKPGKYIVSVVATNTRSILVERLEVDVQEKLAANRMMMKFSPKDPGVDEDVTFSVHLNYSNVDVGYVLYKWTYDGKEIQGWQPVVTLSFSKAKSYVVTVTATNYLNSVKKSVTVQVLKDLTPVNVTASVLGPTRVMVKWKRFAEEAIKLIKEYRVYKSTSGNADFKIMSCTSPTNSSCILDNLSPATTYYIKVSTYSQEYKESAFSNLAFVTTNTSTPGAPGTLRAYPLNSSAIAVDWKAPTKPSGPIKSYTIRYWSHNNPTVKSVNNGPSSSRIFTNLQQDTVYFFEVYANSDSGRSIAAGPAQALTKLSKPTLPPREVKKVSDNGTCAILRWKPPYLSKSDNRSFPAKGYKIQRQDSRVVDAPTNFAIICQLPPGASYKLKVWAYSQAGEGPPAPVTITTQIIKPGAPQNVKASKIQAHEITLRWDPPAQSKGNLTYTVYQLSPLIEKPFEVPPPQTTLTVKELDPYKTYKFAVYAKNSLGSSVKSAVVTATTLGTTPGVVEFVTTETVQPYSASIRVTWSTPSKPNGVIKHYKIKWGKAIIEDPLNTDGFEVTTVDGSESAFTFKHLFSNTYYSFIVTAENDVGEGFQHISPKKERTETALKGTETLRMTFTGPIMDGENLKDFIRQFIKVASMRANILEDRIAAIDVKNSEDPTKGTVVFDLIPPLNSSGVSMETAKAAINNGFKASDWILASGSLRTASRVPVPATPGEKPSVGAQKGGSPNDDSQKKTLAIVIPLAIIGVALLVGLIFYYMKYKSLEKHYRKTGEKDHEEDEMKVVYNEEMQADSPDSIFGDHMKKGRNKAYRDSEKVPLGESDELAMI